MSLAATTVAPPHPHTHGPAGLVIRPLRSGDTATVQAVFDGLSVRSRFLRFHAGIPRLSGLMLRRLADVRPGQDAVYVARIGARPVGLVRWSRMAGENAAADVAVEVVDAAQHLGVGRALLATAARTAQAGGVTSFVAYVCGDNRVIREWILRHGLRAHPDDHTCFTVPVALLLPRPEGGRG